MAGLDLITLRLWLHRAKADAWLVSTDGVGAGVWLPRAEVRVPEDALGGLSGAVPVELPRWLALDRGLLVEDDERQGEMF